MKEMKNITEDEKTKIRLDWTVYFGKISDQSNPQIKKVNYGACKREDLLRFRVTSSPSKDSPGTSIFNNI